MDEQLTALTFPLIFAALWLSVTTLLGGLSGWFALQRRYDRGTERSALTLHMLSGTMGVGVRLNGVLTLSACQSGLRISIWRIFGLFQRPFFVPWQEVHCQSVDRFFQPMSKLVFGSPAVGHLIINRSAWQRLSCIAGDQVQDDAGDHLPTSLLGRKIAQAMVLQWAMATAGATAFFYFVSHIEHSGSSMPLAVCFGFPATVLGLTQVARYIVQIAHLEPKR